MCHYPIICYNGQYRRDKEGNPKDCNLYESYSIGGGLEVSPEDMAAAYGTFARGGYYIKPYSYTKVIFRETDETYEHKYEKVQAMSPETAYMITDMLITATEQDVGGKINVSGTEKVLKGGIKRKDIWVEMPINNQIENIDINIYRAKIDGITHILVKTEKPNRERAIELINKFRDNSKAIGCVFIEEYKESIRIDPFVWVKDIDTLFYENSCGSGTACAGMLFLNKNTRTIKVLQPSGEIIEVFINDKESICISGEVNTDNEIKCIEL